MIVRIIDDLPTARRTVLARRPMEETVAPPHVQARLDAMFGAGTTPAQAVARILDDVRSGGDAALRSYTERIDGALVESPEVPAADLQAAWDSLPDGLRHALQTAAEQLRAFHQREQHPSWLQWARGRRPGPDGQAPGARGPLCAGRHGRLPVLPAAHGHPGPGGRRRRDHRGDAAGPPGRAAR